MKKVSIFILFLAVMATSCKDLLTEYNPSGLTAEAVYSTPEGFESLVNAAYGYQRWWYGKEEGYNISEMGTDTWTSAAGDISPDLSKYVNLQGTNRLLSAEWTALYAGVNLCNAGINRIATVGFTPAMRAQREAELRFLRAFYYWHIVETWGGVHFTLEETKGIESTSNKTPVETFYKQIFEDLQFATKNLANTTTNYGRITRPAAMAFLARMYLTRGLNAEANNMANTILKGNFGYKLEANYADLWKMSNNQGKEIMYAVNYSANLTLNDLANSTTNVTGHGRGSNNGHLHFLMKYDNLPGMLRDITYGRPFNRYMPTKFLLDLYGSADARYDGSFNEVWLANSGTRPKGMNLGDTAVIATRTARTKPAGALYTLVDRDAIYNTDGTAKNMLVYPTLTKHMDNTRLSANEAQSARDAYVIRYAEVYLIAAEAQMKLGKLDSAAINLNVVRTRAAKAGKAAEMQVKPEQVTLDFILDERAREFAGEQMRWFDLKRTGKLLERVKAYNPDATGIQSFHLVRPIPRAQLDAVSNRDVFTQNPGYQ